VITPADCRNGTYPFPFHHGDSCPIHKECPLEHSIKMLGQWRFAPAITVGVLVKTNGSVAYKIRCIGCGDTKVIKQHEANILMKRGYGIGFVSLPTGIDSNICQVRGCGSTITEKQHWAPQAIFGKEANDWPTSPLCPAHHREWHQRVWPGEDLGRRAGAAT